MRAHLHRQRGRPAAALAELLFELGRLREAIPWYEHVAQLSPYELPYLAASHLRLGQIHDRLGDRDTAASHHARALALWHDADPELQPQVAEAQEGLRGRER